jgi:predicted GNAT family acetyltransferase
MEVTSEPDPVRFRAAVEPFLAADTARNQLPLGVLHTIISEPTVYPEFHLWSAREAGDVVAMALRTPPHNVALADPTDPAAIEPLADAVMRDDPQAPGVVANVPWADRFAARWVERASVTPRLTVLQGVFSLTAVREPREAPGGVRRLGERDRELALQWFAAFADEALPEEMRERSRQPARIDSLLDDSNDDSGLWSWDVEGEPRSLTGFTRIPGGSRIGPVYTPPQQRGRGYASNLVARISSWLLETGAEACYLYTDLANPTSNKIYTDIGYEQVAESANLEFDRG